MVIRDSVNKACRKVMAGLHLNEVENGHVRTVWSGDDRPALPDSADQAALPVPGANE